MPRHSKNPEVEEDSSKLDKILSKIIDLEKGLNFLSDQFDEFKIEIETLRKERNEDAKERANTRNKIKEQQIQINDLTNEIGYLLAKDKATSVEVKGIPFTENEDLTKICVEIAAKVGMKLANADIISAYRVQTTRSNLNLLKIKFKDENKRDSFIVEGKKAKLTLSDINRGSNVPIFINEDLPWMIRKLFVLSLTAKRLKGYKYCWTKKAKIYIRKDENSKAILIKSEGDLDRLEG